MKQYTRNELAQIVKAIIDKNYSNPEYLYEQLKRNINGKTKAISKKDLTVDEYKEKGIKVAEAVIKDFYMISFEYIESKLSDEVVSAGKNGFELAEYKDYFMNSAKDRVRELINVKYQRLQADIRKMNKKRKK
jgi:hypothetical protein